jgi:hypothetical protein
MDFFNKKDNRPTIGFAGGLTPGRGLDDDLTPEERKLLEQIAERLLQEHRETLKTLGDE